MLCRKCKQNIEDGFAFCPHCGVKQEAKPRTPKRRGNGTGTVYKRGKTWTAETVIGHKPNKDGVMRPVRITRGGFKTKTAALEALPQLKTERSGGRGMTTIDDLWLSFSKAALGQLSASKQGHYRTARKKLEEIAYIDISLLNIDDLQDIVDEQAPTFYPARDMKTLLSRLYKRAVAAQVVQVNLAEYIVLPRLDEKPTVPFNDQEIVTLWQGWGSGDIICGYTLLMIYTGMMPGELCGLYTSMVDFDKQTISGCGIKTKVRKTTPIILPDVILPVARQLCDNALSDGKVLPYRRDAFYAEFRAMIERYQLRKELKPYSCRHTTATTLALAETPLLKIKDVMRHAKTTTTQRYVHMDTTPLLEAANEAYNAVSTTNIQPSKSQ